MVKSYLKFLIFILIIFLVPNVFAQDFNVSTSNITSPDASGTGKYSGLEIYNSGSNNVYNIGTRYNGQLSRIVFNLSAGGYADPNGFEQGHTYTLTMNMATDDWRNRFGSVSVKCEGSSGQELSNGRVNYINYKKINFSFTTPTSSWCQFVYVDLKSSNILSTAFTGVSNWNLSSMVITDPMYDDSGSGGSSGGGSTSNNQDIIDNNTTNTNNIINNNTTNTNNIIDNANQNTQDIIDNQNQLLGSQCSNIFNFGGSKNVGNGASNINLGVDFISFSGTSSNVLGSNFVIYPLTLIPNTNYYFKLNNGYQISLLNSSYSTLFNTTLNSFQFNSGNNSTILLAFFSPQNQTTRYSNVMVSTENKSFCVFDSYTSKIDETNQAISDSTNSIIDNQNSNTQAQIDSQKVCKNYDKTSILIDNKYLASDGGMYTSNYWGVTDYLDIYNSTINVINSNTSTTTYLCFYNDSKGKISCSSLSTFTGNITIPQGTKYVRVSINKITNLPQFKICKNGNQALTDSLTDSNIDSDLGGGFFDDFENNDFGFSDIVKIPLNTINQLTSTSCSPISIPIPFTNGSVSLPCMTQIYQDNIPTIYNIWKVVSFGIIAYFIVIDLFHIVKGFKDPESDKVEVLDL